MLSWALEAASPSGPTPSFPLLPSSLSQINVFDLLVL